MVSFATIKHQRSLKYDVCHVQDVMSRGLGIAHHLLRRRISRRCLSENLVDVSATPNINQAWYGYPIETGTCRWTTYKISGVKKLAQKLNDLWQMTKNGILRPQDFNQNAETILSWCRGTAIRYYVSMVYTTLQKRGPESQG